MNEIQGPMYDRGVCRCCGRTRKCRVLVAKYENRGTTELYSEMISECFGIVLSNLHGQEIDRLICALCVSRLREACTFQKQMLKCEEKFLKQLETGETKSNLQTYNIEMELENRMIHDGDADDGHDNDNGVESDDAEDNTVKKNVPDEEPIKQFGNRLRALLTSSTPLLPQRKSVKQPTKQHKSEEIKVKSAALKKMLLKKSKELKAKMSDKDCSDSLISRRRFNNKKKMKIFHNSVTIVTNSFVCPFSNIKDNYYCYYCRKIFKDPAELRDHTMTHNVSYYPYRWTKHRAVQVDITRIDCRLCDQHIETIDNLKQHLTTAHKLTIYPDVKELLQFKLRFGEMECLDCGEKYCFIDQLLRHMVVHYGNHVCHICGKTFVLELTLASHLRTHMVVSKPDPCHICGKVFSTKAVRRIHIAHVHEKKCHIKCLRCDEMFISYHQRNRHLVQAHGIAGNFPCSYCNKVFTLRMDYARHIKGSHEISKEPNAVCRTCGKVFKKRKYLKQHMRSHMPKAI